ncbi:MAG TPA: GNAT family N-acetyltransferase [Solirubrobacterales bacterium]|nr:GNAT family N-acetyltransferase [Solirubrobacterales bacterium]
MAEERRTQRLILRQPTADDRSLYHSHFTHPEIERWLRPPPLPPFNAGAVDELIENDQAHWSDHGFGPWIAIEQETGAFAGRGGLHWTTVEDKAMIELAWSIEPSRHNRGYATEMATEAIELARERRIEELVALVLPANVPSRRVAEKVGCERNGEVDHAGLLHLLFRSRLRS